MYSDLYAMIMMTDELEQEGSDHYLLWGSFLVIIFRKRIKLRQI
jgi:hypothetical protein